MKDNIVKYRLVDEEGFLSMSEFNKLVIRDCLHKDKIAVGYLNESGDLKTDYYDLLITALDLHTFFEKVEYSTNEDNKPSYKIKETIQAGDKTIIQEFVNLEDYLELKKKQKKEEVYIGALGLGSVATSNKVFKPTLKTFVNKNVLDSYILEYACFLYTYKPVSIEALAYFNVTMDTEVRRVSEKSNTEYFYNIPDDYYTITLLKAYLEKFRLCGQLFIFNRIC